MNPHHSTTARTLLSALLLISYSVGSISLAEASDTKRRSPKSNNTTSPHRQGLGAFIPPKSRSDSSVPGDRPAQGSSEANTTKNVDTPSASSKSEAQFFITLFNKAVEQPAETRAQREHNKQKAAINERYSSEPLPEQIKWMALAKKTELAILESQRAKTNFDLEQSEKLEEALSKNTGRSNLWIPAIKPYLEQLKQEGRLTEEDYKKVIDLITENMSLTNRRDVEGLEEEISSILLQSTGEAHRALERDLINRLKEVAAQNGKSLEQYESASGSVYYYDPESGKMLRIREKRDYQRGWGSFTDLHTMVTTDEAPALNKFLNSVGDAQSETVSVTIRRPEHPVGNQLVEFIDPLRVVSVVDNRDGTQTITIRKSGSDDLRVHFSNKVVSYKPQSQEWEIFQTPLIAVRGVIRRIVFAQFIRGNAKL